MDRYEGNPADIVLGWATILVLLAVRRFRHLFVFLGAFFLVQALATYLANGILEQASPLRPAGIAVLGLAGPSAYPLAPVAMLTARLVSMLYALIPQGRMRQAGKAVVAAIVALVALARMYLAVDTPTGVLVGVIIGVTIPLVAFRWLCPDEVFPVTYRRGRTAHLDVGGRRGEAIRRALHDQLGVIADDVQPFGLEGSAGSTPLRIKVKGDQDAWLFAKLYARSHLRADRSYKLGRALLYGRLEDEKPFNTVKRLVQQEDYALALMRRAGLPSPEPYGVAQLTPEREYLIVFEFIEGASEVGEAEVDEAVIDQGLAMVRKLWDANLAHRDIKPANLLVREGKLYLIDVFFAEIHPSPWRQAVDLANMMLCLALRSSPEQVYQRALGQFSVEEITEAFAAARGLALPSQLRKLMRAQGRNLHAEFVRLLPEAPRPIGVQRWSTRRVALLLLVVLALIPAIPLAWAFARSSANPGGAATVTGGNGACTQIEELWLEAQAVPSASRIPCVQAFPAGVVGALRVRDGESVIELSRGSLEININSGGQHQANTEAGSVTVRFTAACAGPTSGEGQTVAPGVRRFQVEGAAGTAEAADVFPGGCVTYRTEPGIGPTVPLLDQAQRAVTYRTRDDLREALRRISDGRLQLDPEAGG